MKGSGLVYVPVVSFKLKESGTHPDQVKFFALQRTAITVHNVKVNQSRYRPGVAERVPGS
jgi:hypothetical protein